MTAAASDPRAGPLPPWTVPPPRRGPGERSWEWAWPPWPASGGVMWAWRPCASPRGFPEFSPESQAAGRGGDAGAPPSGAFRPGLVGALENRGGTSTRSPEALSPGEAARAAPGGAFGIPVPWPCPARGSGPRWRPCGPTALHGGWDSSAVSRHAGVLSPGLAPQPFP